MKTLLMSLAAAALMSTAAEAGSRKCNSAGNNNCTPCQSTQWYKAKDGTYREMMPYAKALSRAEDADDMEPVLKQAQADLTEANARIAALQAEAEKAKADFEAQLADLRLKLEAEKQSVAAQKDRADKAESAHKQCIEQVAELREDAKKKDEALAAGKAELNNVSGERDTLKTAKADLEKQVADLTAAKTAAEDALKQVQDELAKAKQDAAESKKSKVEGEPESKDGDAPKEGDAPKTDNAEVK